MVQGMMVVVVSDLLQFPLSLFDELGEEAEAGVTVTDPVIDENDEIVVEEGDAPWLLLVLNLFARRFLIKVDVLGGVGTPPGPGEREPALGGAQS